VRGGGKGEAPQTRDVGGEVDFHGTWVSAELRETDVRLKREG
jgi:hypothetical protein